MRKLTNEEFLEKVKSIHGNDYILLSCYDGAKSKINVIHKVCGSEFETTPNNLYNGGCKKCGLKNMKKKQRKTNEKFISEVLKYGNREYETLEGYINNTTKIKMLHKECGYEYYVTPRDFLSGRRCPGCKTARVAKKNTLTHNEFLESIFHRLDEYELLSEYKNARTKILVRHINCGKVYKVTPSHFKNGRSCPSCKSEVISLKLRKKQSLFEKEMNEIHGDIKILGEYVNQKTKIDCRHTLCNYEFKATPDSLLSGSGCPQCKESRGEREIRNFLESKGVKYEREKTFDDCRYIQKLRFDFAVYLNGDLSFLIEYQGVQHYEPKEFFGGVEEFKLRVKRDNIKRDFAKNNRIKLVEIKYNQSVVEVLKKLIPW